MFAVLSPVTVLASALPAIVVANALPVVAFANVLHVALWAKMLSTTVFANVLPVTVLANVLPATMQINHISAIRVLCWGYVIARILGASALSTNENAIVNCTYLIGKYARCRQIPSRCSHNTVVYRGVRFAVTCA